MGFLETHFPNVLTLQSEFIQATLETIQMVVISSIIAGTLGIAVGVLMVVTNQGGILENAKLYNIIEKIVNVFRSIPFIILLALISPFTRLVVGTTIGTNAAIVPIVVGTIPFFSRQVENALLEVNPGVVEAAISMGASPLEIIFQVYLREGLTALIRVSAVTIINLISLTAMAGVVGGGGLGNMAIARGHNRFQGDVVLVSTLLILVLVFISQAIGNYFIKKTTH